MQSSPEDVSRLDRDETGGTLPRQLTRGLSPQARHALEHPVRRRILRALGEDPGPHTINDLQTRLPDASLSRLSYHALVLAECGSLTITDVTPVRGTIVRSVVSDVVDNAQYIVVLRATEELDDTR